MSALCRSRSNDSFLCAYHSRPRARSYVCHISRWPGCAALAPSCAVFVEVPHVSSWRPCASCAWRSGWHGASFLLGCCSGSDCTGSWRCAAASAPAASARSAPAYEPPLRSERFVILCDQDLWSRPLARTCGQHLCSETVARTCGQDLLPVLGLDDR